MPKGIMYEVAECRYGRKQIINSSSPMEGCLEWPKAVWTVITKRPIGLKRAKELADASPTFATVQIWQSAEKVYENGKPRLVPEGDSWYPAHYQTIFG